MSAWTGLSPAERRTVTRFLRGKEKALTPELEAAMRERAIHLEEQFRGQARTFAVIAACALPFGLAIGLLVEPLYLILPGTTLVMALAGWLISTRWARRVARAAADLRAAPT